MNIAKGVLGTSEFGVPPSYAFLSCSCVWHAFTVGSAHQEKKAKQGTVKEMRRGQSAGWVWPAGLVSPQEVPHGLCVTATISGLSQATNCGVRHFPGTS